MLGAELCLPTNSVLKSQPPDPQNVTVLGDQTFKEVIKGKWGSYGWALIQYDWHPYKKRRLRHRQRDNHVRTQGEDGLLQAKERSLWGNQPCRCLDLGLLASRTVRT